MSKETDLFLRQVNQMTLSRAIYLLEQINPNGQILTGDNRAPVDVVTQASFDTDLLIVLGNSDQGMRIGQFVEKLKEVSTKRTETLKSTYANFIPDAPIWVNHQGSVEMDVPLDHFNHTNGFVRIHVIE